MVGNTSSTRSVVTGYRDSVVTTLGYEGNARIGMALWQSGNMNGSCQNDAAML
jgi:hypothetical protein